MTEAVAQVFTSTGIAFNFLVFGSQAFMFRRMIAEGDSTRYTALPSLSLLLCMSLWSAYTLFFLGDIVQMYLANFSGIAVAIVYLAIIVYLAKSWRRRAGLTVATIALQLAAWAYFVILARTVPHGAAKTAGGVVAVVVNVSFFFSPLAALRTAWRNKDTSRFPVALSFIMFTASANWTVAGACIPDYYVATPNAVGTVMGALQLVVIGLIRRHNRSLGLPPGGSRAGGSRADCCADTGEGKVGTKVPPTSSDADVAAAGAAPTLTSGCSTASEGGLEGSSGSGGDSKRSSAVGEELVGVQVDNAADPVDAAPEAV